jgi:hypothetical protein
VVCACYCYDWGFMFGEMEMRTGGRGAVVRLAGGQAGEVGFGSGFWVKVGIISTRVRSMDGDWRTKRRANLVMCVTYVLWKSKKVRYARCLDRWTWIVDQDLVYCD